MGITPLLFAVTMDKASTAPVTVKYATSSGTATAGADYKAATGTPTFEPGVTAQTVHVDIIGDTAVEPNETFEVTLSDSSGAAPREQWPPAPSPTTTPPRHRRPHPD